MLGTPSREQIKTMNPNYMEHKFPQIKVRCGTCRFLRFNAFQMLTLPSVSSRRT